MSAVMKILVAAAVLGVVAYLVHRGLDSLLGRSLIAQIVSVGVALTAGAAVYGVIVLKAGIPEARQIVDLFARRLRRGRS
jgi:putative peptidoglycan lipid II flippase